MKKKRADIPIVIVGSDEFIHPHILKALFESEDIGHDDDDMPPREFRYIQQFHLNQLAYA